MLARALEARFEITALGRSAENVADAWRHIQCDLSSPQAVEGAVLQLQQAEPYDAVAFCAGGPMDRPKVAKNSASWEAITYLNYLSVVVLSDAVLSKNSAAKCVLISSDSVATGNSSPAYCCAKAALSAYGRQLEKFGYNTLLVEPPAFYGEDNYWVQVERESYDRFKSVEDKQVDGRFLTVVDVAKPILNFISLS